MSVTGMKCALHGCEWAREAYGERCPEHGAVGVEIVDPNVAEIARLRKVVAVYEKAVKTIAAQPPVQDRRAKGHLSRGGLIAVARGALAAYSLLNAATPGGKID